MLTFVRAIESVGFFEIVFKLSQASVFRALGTC